MSDSRYFTLLGGVWIGVSYAADASGSDFGVWVALAVVFMCFAKVFAPDVRALWRKVRPAR